MKKIISALLIGAAIVSLASCLNKAAPLHGDWHTEIALDEEAVSDVLTFYDFTAEEIALIDKSGLTTVKEATFSSDGSYDFHYDIETTKQHFSDFFDRCMHTVHDNLGSLSDIFGGVEYGFDEFADYYADVYGYESYEAYRSATASAFVTDYYAFGDGSIEHGMYKVSGDAIIMTADGEEAPMTLSYSLSEDGTLSLIYTNTTEQYHRAAE